VIGDQSDFQGLALCLAAQQTKIQGRFESPTAVGHHQEHFAGLSPLQLFSNDVNVVIFFQV